MKGGNIGYTTILDPIGGNLSYKGYTTSNMPIYEMTDIFNRDLAYFNIINENSNLNENNNLNKIRGGGSKEFTQLSLIKELSKSLVKLDVNDLSELSLLLINRDNKEYIKHIKKLGKNNLLALSSILLLNNYANKKIYGGNKINNLMKHSGYNYKDKSIILKNLDNTFNLRKKNKYIKLLENIPLEKLDANKMVKILNKLLNIIYKKQHCKKEENKKLYLKKYKKQMNDVYNLLSPIGFTIFINKVEKL